MRTDLIKRIENANADEISDAAMSFMKRYGELFPDWSVMFVSIEKGKDRKEQYDRMICRLQEMKEMDE